MSKIQEKTKDSYKVVNWSGYNKSLKSRGSLTVWLEDDIAASWYDKRRPKKGGQYEYSDTCILILRQLKEVYNLGYRQLEGFSESLLELMEVDLKVPCYTQICRRSKHLKVNLATPKSRAGLYLVVDSTGLKVYGEGEWKVRKHGYSKRRTWRKLHLAVDESTGMIYAEVLTGNDKDDASQLEPLLEQVDDSIDKLSADGAYDRSNCWDLLIVEEIQPIIPPRKDAVYWNDELGQRLPHPRNEILENIEVFGREGWKHLSGYHQRSLAETSMFRYKKIFGEEMKARCEENQKTETRIKARCINKMTALGMPESVRVY